MEETAPLPGSTIVVKRTRKQVQADTDGKFNLQVLKGDTLIVSYTGLEPNEIIITSKNHYTITLHSVVQPSRKSKRYYRRYAKEHNGMVPEF